MVAMSDFDKARYPFVRDEDWYPPVALKSVLAETLIRDAYENHAEAGRELVANRWDAAADKALSAMKCATAALLLEVVGLNTPVGDVLEIDDAFRKLSRERGGKYQERYKFWWMLAYDLIKGPPFTASSLPDLITPVVSAYLRQAAKLAAGWSDDGLRPTTQQM